MNILFVKHRVRDGYEKVYRFNADRQNLSFGSSRKADVRLPKSIAANIEGCLEFDKTNGKGAWVYHSFSLKESEPIIVPLNSRGQFRIGPHEFTTQVVEQKSLFDEQNDSNDLGDQLVLLMLNGHIYRSYTVKVGETLTVTEAGERINVQTRQSRVWINEVQGSFEIRQRTMAKTHASEMLRSFKEAMNMSKQDRLTVGAIAMVFLLGIVSLTLAPKSAEPELAAEPPKTMTSPTVVKLTPPKEMKTVAPRETQAKDAGVRRMNNIQNLSKSIANRAGKFLAKALRAPASIGPNGTLNAPVMGVGRLDGPATDWNAAAGESVSGKVAGGLGGNGTNSRLSGGSVGQNGVNLLEDESEVAGGLDKEVIADFIRRHIGHILYCYERSLSANPNLFGKVSVRFVIGASGQVETQKIGESTLKEAKVESCILDKVAQWKFPTPKGGVQVMVTYPFLFKTTN